MNQQNDFREKLIASQQFTPEYREKYNERLQKMIERTLTTSQKIGLGISVFVGLLSMILIAVIMTSSMGISLPLKVVIGFLGLVTLVITIFRAYILITGKINLRLQPKYIVYIGYYSILLFVMAMIIIAQTTGSIYMLLVSLIPLVVVTGKLIIMQIGQSELNVQEKLLEIELKLAELNEKMQSDKS